jgi:uncharacterized protein
LSQRAVIVDTNVLVAGLLTAREDSPVARVLDGMLAAAFPFVVSHALMAEYRNVLMRPKLRKLHGLNQTEVDTLLNEIALHAIVLAPAVAPRAPDPGDQLLWELLAAKADLLLVTGDKRLLRDAGMQGRVITAQGHLSAP